MKIETTTKLLELAYNPHHFGSDGSSRLAFRIKTDGESSVGSGIQIEDKSLSLSTSGLKFHVVSSLSTSINDVDEKLGIQVYYHQ